MAIDGTSFDLADTPANADFFGRPSSSRGEQSAFPQAKLVAIAECGTHAMFDAVIGPCRTWKIELARELVGRLTPGLLALADRGFYGFKMWTEAAATGADLLWRVRSTLNPKHLETLSDGSWLARIVPSSGVKRMNTTPLTVRVIDYTIDDGREKPRRIPTAHHHPRPGPGTCGGPRGRLRATVDRIYAHRLRHTAAMDVAKELLGHVYTVTTMGYAKVDLASLRELVVPFGQVPR